mmetsp:Transcript_12040/g.27991  ORF Transcript_12040/g.27991 Transcript_12040/m.27991 type:complete len:207 (-) Transcript_12040:144-764(-)
MAITWPASSASTGIDSPLVRVTPPRAESWASTASGLASPSERSTLSSVSCTDSIVKSSTISATLNKVTTKAASRNSPPHAEPSTAMVIIASIEIIPRRSERTAPRAMGTSPAPMVAQARRCEIVNRAPPPPSPRVASASIHPVLRPIAKSMSSVHTREAKVFSSGSSFLALDCMSAAPSRCSFSTSTSISGAVLAGMWLTTALRLT